MRFRLVPKSWMTSGTLCTLFQNTGVFGAHHENLNELNRPMLSAAEICTTTVCRNVRFTVYADIRRGSLETRRRTTVGRVCLHNVVGELV